MSAQQNCPTYVIGDVHGHREPLVDALREHGIVDANDNWACTDAQVWFLGDFVDRGPDGIGVIDLVMKLWSQAADAGGRVQSLLGNHEILLLGVHRFGDQEVPGGFGARSFARSWTLNGGHSADLHALTDEHVEWLTGLPAIAHAADHLLLHSDTTEYFAWGTRIDEINKGIHDVLSGDDIADWWEVWRRLTTRYAFRGHDGPEVADAVLERLGGQRIVHGHSVIADQLGVPPVFIDGPCLYADGKVLGIDAGLFVGGPCLVVELPWQSNSAE